MSETRQLAERIAGAAFTAIPQAAVEASKQALMDFIGVTIAGMDEPLSKILRADAREQGGHPHATIFGTGERASIQQATLINGAAGHAHDYDDVQMAMMGHPTVPVAPVVLALAEQRGLGGADVINAFATGVDAECIIGEYAGSAHYKQGWHNTGTVGTFGATAAAAVLLGLDADEIARALGIAGTQAAGLKSQFGTMCKPLHAGHAASTGAQAASLAQKGFSSRETILEMPQGFMDTQSASADAARFNTAMQQPAFAQDILFKYHAACYLTHSAIEATARLCEQNAFDPNRIKQVTVAVDRGHFKVCNIQAPQTGLEAKFSLRFTVAMTLAGVDTSSIDIFTDALTQDAHLTRYRDLVTVVAHENKNPNTIVRIETEDGNVFTEELDVGIPNRDLDGQWRRLETKFRALVTPRLGSARTDTLVNICRDLHQQDDLRPLFAALTQPQE